MEIGKDNNITVSWTSSNGIDMVTKACFIEVMENRLEIWTYQSPHAIGQDYQIQYLPFDRVSNIKIISK